jgi:AcrR family transcriptional regulator
MVRPREFNEASVLSAAEDAFWLGGYEGTSLDDLTSATGLGKGSLYGAFGTKHDVFVRVFDDYCDRIVAVVANALTGPSETAMDRLAAYLRSVATRTAGDVDHRGCLLAKGTAELAGRDPVIAARASAAFAALEAILARTLRQARRHGDLTTVASVPALARTVLATLRGMEALGKAGASLRTLRDVADTTIALLAAAPTGAEAAPSPGRSGFPARR